MMRSSSAGTAGIQSYRRRRDAPSECCQKSPRTCLPEKAMCPVAISVETPTKRITYIYRCARRVPCPSACSGECRPPYRGGTGARQVRVIHMIAPPHPWFAGLGRRRERAWRGEVQIFAWPRSVTKILAGLMSRCTILVCGQRRAHRQSRCSAPVADRDRAVPARGRCFSVRPFRNSIAIKGWPWSSPMSWIVQYLDELSAEAACASR